VQKHNHGKNMNVNLTNSRGDEITITEWKIDSEQ